MKDNKTIIKIQSAMNFFNACYFDPVIGLTLILTGL